MPDRFVVVKGSSSWHCCFEFTVVDTNRPQFIDGEEVGFETVCECFEEADANMIVKALNTPANIG